MIIRQKWRFICRFAGMKRILLSIALSFLSSIAFGQYWGHIPYSICPKKQFHYSHVRYEEDYEPEIWRKYPNANHILAVYNSWEISTSNGMLTPQYLVFKNDSPDSVGIYEACKLAESYFLVHPDRREYDHKDFIMTTRIVRKKAS